MAACKLIWESMTWEKENAQGKLCRAGVQHVSKVLELYILN